MMNREPIRYTVTMFLVEFVKGGTLFAEEFWKQSFSEHNTVYCVEKCFHFLLGCLRKLKLRANDWSKQAASHFHQ